MRIIIYAPNFFLLLFFFFSRIIYVIFLFINFVVRDYSFLLGGATDSAPQFRTLQVPMRDEGANVDAAAQAIPPAPGTVTPSHPLLVRHTDPHGAVTYRVYRGGGRQRGYRLSTPSAAWHVYSGTRRHQNPPPILPG